VNVSKIEHIGIAVKSLENAIPYYETLLGSACYVIEEVTNQKVKTAFFRVGETKIELYNLTGFPYPSATSNSSKSSVNII